MSESGNQAALSEKHLIPNLRSSARKAGKMIEKAEDWFQDLTQTQTETHLKAELTEKLAGKGINIHAVLIRDVRLPQYIREAIEQKKIREQLAEQQLAELDRFKTEQQEKIEAAKALETAAKSEATATKTKADATAYEIEKITAAMAANPGYIQIKALETLGQISQDPAAKLYFLNGESPNPLPLMHLGDTDAQGSRGEAVRPVVK